MKLVNFERRCRASRESFENECLIDGRLKRLRLIRSILYGLMLVWISLFTVAWSFTWIVGPVVVLVADTVVSVLIEQRRKRLKQPYLFL